MVNKKSNRENISALERELYITITFVIFVLINMVIVAFGKISIRAGIFLLIFIGLLTRIEIFRIRFYQ